MALSKFKTTQLISSTTAGIVSQMFESSDMERWLRKRRIEN